MNAYCNCISRDAWKELKVIGVDFNMPWIPRCEKCNLFSWVFTNPIYEKQFLERLLVLECKEQERDALETLISEEGSIE